jgi:hypothetical protein
LSYATGFASKWDKHMTAVEGLAAFSPLMVGKGNHEQDDATHPPNGDSPQTIKNGNDAGGECGVGADFRYRMPYPTPTTNDSGTTSNNVSQAGRAARGWYSLDASLVHFAMINTELDLSASSEQYAWLAADLAAVDRLATPWVVVMGHRPVYQMSHELVYDPNVWRVRPLLEQWKVDLALYGHEHYAEVTCPILLNNTSHHDHGHDSPHDHDHDDRHSTGESHSRSRSYSDDFEDLTRCAAEADEDADGWAAPTHAVIGNAGQSLTPLPKVPPHYDLYEAEEWGFSTLEVDPNGEALTLLFWGDAPEDEDPPLRFNHTLHRKYPRTATPQQQ